MVPIAARVLEFRTGKIDSGNAPISEAIREFSQACDSKGVIDFIVCDRYWNWSGTIVDLDIIASTLMNDESLFNFLTY